MDQYTNNVIAEIRKLNTSIKNIGDAIVAKGVPSARKLYSFAEEILTKKLRRLLTILKLIV